MIRVDELETGMTSAIAESRKHLSVSDDGKEAVDQVIILVSYLLSNGETIVITSPIARRDPNMGQAALELSRDLGVL